MRCGRGRRRRPGRGRAAVLAADDKAATKGRIKQSIVFWCFNGFGDKWDMETTCQVAKELGCVSVELIGAGGLGRR